MTLEELNHSFERYYPYLVNFAKKKCGNVDDAMDHVHTLYSKMAQGKEYHKVQPKYIKSWWFYRLRSVLHDYKTSEARTKRVEQQYHKGLNETVDMEMTPTEEEQVVREYWNGLSRVQQCRYRQKVQQEGGVLYPFMAPKQIRS